MYNGNSVTIRISPMESKSARKWCNENKIMYSISGHTFDEVVEYDKELDPMDTDMSMVSDPYISIIMSFRFITLEDAVAFKLRWS